MYDDFNLKKTLWSPWFIQKYVSVVKVKTADISQNICITFEQRQILRRCSKMIQMLYKCWDLLMSNSALSIIICFRFGRRPVFFCSIVAQVVLGCAAAASPTLWFFYGVYFLQGCVQVSVYLTSFVLGESVKKYFVSQPKNIL